MSKHLESFFVVLTAAGAFGAQALASGAGSDVPGWIFSYVATNQPGELPPMALTKRSNELLDKKRWSHAHPLLVLQCKDHSLELHVEWGMTFSPEVNAVREYYGHSHGGAGAWLISRGRSETYYSGGRAWQYVQELEYFKQLRLEIYASPFGDTLASAIFDIAGLKEAIEPIRRACPPSWY